MNKRSEQEESQPIQAAPEDLAARLNEVEGIDEDIATIIANNWRQVAVTVALVIAGAWLFNEYQGANGKKLEQSSKEFIEAQKLFETIKQGSNKEGSEKDLVAMREKFRTLAESSNENFYSKAASIYQALDLLKSNSTDQALEILRKFSIHRYESKQQVGVASGDDISESMLEEFAALLYAKGLIAKGGDDLKTARSYLIGLAYQAQLLNVEAILTLARISNDSTERQEASTVAHDVAVGRPELADTIESNIAPYGYSIGG